MTWGELNFETATWTVPSHRMKLGVTHSVPLSKAALDILNAQKRGNSDAFVFSLRPGTPLSDMTLSAVIKRMSARKIGNGEHGYLDTDGRVASPHGFRSSFRMWAAEQSNEPRDVAEFALAHKLPDEIEAAYQRSTLFVRRINLMQEWSDFVIDQETGLAIA
jgi:integrase